jgi:hypothetical protein
MPDRNGSRNSVSYFALTLYPPRCNRDVGRFDLPEPPHSAMHLLLGRARPSPSAQLRLEPVLAGPHVDDEGHR